MISLPNGADAPLEVVSEPGITYTRLESAFEKHGRAHVDLELGCGWQVDVEHDAQLKRLWGVLPGHIARIDAAHSPADRWIVAVPPELSELGVRHLIPRPDEPRLIQLYPAGFRMSGATSHEVLADFVQDMFRRHGDVPGKLLAINAPERHAFLWAMTASGHRVVDFLGIGRDWDEAHDGALDIPLGITDVWVANDQGRSRVMHWTGGRWRLETLNEWSL